jgi:hypothetical protein
MIVSEVQAPAGMTAAADFRSAVGGGTIPAASTPPPVLAAASLSAADPSASSASHILAQFEIGGWSAAGTKDDAEGQQIGGIDASHEEENGNPKLTPTPGPAAGLSASDAKAGAIRGRLLPFGWLFSLVLQAARACWVRMVVPAASWLWLAVTTSPASPAAAAAVPAHQHLKPLPTLHHLTVHESRNPLLPPGLLYLATLTLVALVIHPDGYTWVVLRRIRCVVFLVTVVRSAALPRLPLPISFLHSPGLYHLPCTENSWQSPSAPPPRCGRSSSRTTGPSSRRSSPWPRSPRSSFSRTCCGEP